MGVDRNASIEDIKKAYRELVKKYHPDRYQDNPLKDLADEKLAEINEAYEYIMENYGREQNGSSDSGSYSNSSNGYAGYDPDFQRIRGYINSRNFVVAEEELNRIGTRNAEWYFLMGSVLIEKGNFYKGYEYIQKAVKMDPDNEEYQKALDNLNFKKIREYIFDRKLFLLAEEELNKIGTRNAEWYFLMGSVLTRKGEYFSKYGYEYIQEAVNMDPDDEEYQSALDYFKNSYRAKNGKYYDKSGESNDNTSCEQSCEVCICLVFGIYACWNYFHS